MKIVLQGFSGVLVARLFCTFIYSCRCNPLLVKRESFSSFLDKAFKENLFLMEYSKDDIQAILTCINDPDSNGIEPIEKMDALSLKEIAYYIEAVFKAIKDLSIIKMDDLWESYPLKDALTLLFSQNPDFKLQTLLEILEPLEKEHSR